MSDKERLAHLPCGPTNAHNVLIPWVNLFNWRLGAEIGVLRGKTLFALLEACPKLRMFGVDQWKVREYQDTENFETYAHYDMDVLRDTVIRRARHFSDRCTILEGDSVHMAQFVKDESLDFVFLDAGHTYEEFERDLLAWAPKVKRSGYLTGHDWNWPTVEAALNAYCPSWAKHSEAVWSCPRGELTVARGRLASFKRETR